MLEEVDDLERTSESRLLTASEQNVRGALLKDLHDILKAEEATWSQRSREKWLAEGDSNTAFFHRVASHRRRTNRITSLVIDSSVMDNQRDIIRETAEHFKGLLREVEEQHVSMDWDVLYPHTTDMVGLEDPFEEEEIKRPVFSLRSDRAPGTDDFPLMFYTTFWEIIKWDLMRIFEELYNGSLQMHRLNEALIVLIPKKEGAESISDFRPISLLNGVYKIVTKVLANRLGKVIQSLIDPIQSAFLAGKSTLHSVATAQELIMACQRHNWE